jgi:hypothetical protein
MTTTPDVDSARDLAVALCMPGRLAGRQVDGVEHIVDGVSRGWSPPRWERLLAERRWDRDRDGAVYFEVRVVDLPAQSFVDVRSALREARRLVEMGVDCWSVIVMALTSAGLEQRVVTGTPIVGMAIGAVEDPPTIAIDSPSWLPRYLPGEEPPRRHRYVIGRQRKRPPSTDAQPEPAER